MAEIPLYRSSLVALVDDDVAEWLGGFRWIAHRSGVSTKLVYARRRMKCDGVWRDMAMHREILGDTEEWIVDHINGNGLDNRRDNLRLLTHSENLRNRYPYNRFTKEN